jgi:hypothetical protein
MEYEKIPTLVVELLWWHEKFGAGVLHTQIALLFGMH